MDRREALAALATAGIGIKTLPGQHEEKIKGVGVLRYPAALGDALTRKNTREIAKMLADFIRPGAIIALPNDRDYTGAYCWDFRIEGGDMSQVKIERNE